MYTVWFVPCIHILSIWKEINTYSQPSFDVLLLFCNAYLTPYILFYSQQYVRPVFCFVLFLFSFASHSDLIALSIRERLIFAIIREPIVSRILILADDNDEQRSGCIIDTAQILVYIKIYRILNSKNNKKPLIIIALQ